MAWLNKRPTKSAEHDVNFVITNMSLFFEVLLQIQIVVDMVQKQEDCMDSHSMAKEKPSTRVAG